MAERRVRPRLRTLPGHLLFAEAKDGKGSTQKAGATEVAQPGFARPRAAPRFRVANDLLQWSDSGPEMGVVEQALGTEIFVIDDDPAVREALVDVFSLEGYRPRTFASAEQALAEIHRGARLAAIVLDVWLPGMSGREFVAALRASPRAAIPVVVLSGAGWTEQIECGGDRILRKPIEGRAVVRAVDRLVAGGGESRAPLTTTAHASTDARVRPTGNHRPR